MSLRIDSLADLPPNIQAKVAGKIIAQQKKRNKYGNIQTTVNGIKFDSKKEADRYMTLLDAEKRSLIYDLRLQHEFTLQEAYTTPDGKRIRAIRYKADFTYRKTKDGPLVVEDVKSSATKTKEYELKKKLMADKGYIIQEV